MHINLCPKGDKIATLLYGFNFFFFSISQQLFVISLYIAWASINLFNENTKVSQKNEGLYPVWCGIPSCKNLNIVLGQLLQITKQICWQIQTITFCIFFPWTFSPPVFMSDLSSHFKQFTKGSRKKMWQAHMPN